MPWITHTQFHKNLKTGTVMVYFFFKTLGGKWLFKKLKIRNGNRYWRLQYCLFVKIEDYQPSQNWRWMIHIMMCEDLNLKYQWVQLKGRLFPVKWTSHPPALRTEIQKLCWRFCWHQCSHSSTGIHWYRSVGTNNSENCSKIKLSSWLRGRDKKRQPCRNY